ncbi:MAG: hypothetical protein ABI972_11500 [Acidobacteriota bacterium]
MIRLLAALVCLAGIACAEEKWTYVATPNFEVYTTSGAGDAKGALKRFELVRDFFSQVLGLTPQTGTPVRLIAFNSEKEFAPYKPNEVAAAFYLPGLDRDFIVVGDLDNNLWPIATHEYVHLLMKYSGMRVPVWLNEGTAELFSTMTQVADVMRVGVAPVGRILEIRNGKPIPLEELFAADHDSGRYNSKRHAGMFYAESWALTHMLYLDKRYMQERSKFMKAVLAGTPPADAFQTIYGKSLQQVFRDLEGYVRQDALFAANFDFKPSKDVGRIEPRKVDLLEARVVTTELLSSISSKKKAAGEAVEALLKDAAGDPQWAAKAHETAAFYYWRNTAREKALEHFAKAVELGSTSARAYADYAMILGSSDLAKSEQLLTKAVSLRPDWTEARVRLAGVYSQQKKYGAALATILEMKRVRPAEAFDLFQVSALAYAGLGQYKDAHDALVKAEQYADSDSRKLYVQKLATYIEHSEQRAELARDAGTTPEVLAKLTNETEADGERPPVLRREIIPVEAGETELPTSVTDEQFRARLMKQQGEGVHGEFVKMDCSGEKPVIVLATPEKSFRFVVDDFGQVLVSGAGGASVELVCGDQKKQKLTVRYGPAAGSGFDGVVKGLAFE